MSANDVVRQSIFDVSKSTSRISTLVNDRLVPAVSASVSAKSRRGRDLLPLAGADAGRCRRRDVIPDKLPKVTKQQVSRKNDRREQRRFNRALHRRVARILRKGLSVPLTTVANAGSDRKD